MSNVIPAEIPDYYRTPSHIAPPALPSSIGWLLMTRQQETQLQWKDENRVLKKERIFASLRNWVGETLRRIVKGAARVLTKHEKIL